MSSDLKWAFIVPLIIVVTTGIISAGFIVRAIRHAGTDPAFRSAMYTAKIVGIIATVTGVAWIFAVLVVVSSEVAFSYLFALFASSQGVALFYFHVRHHCVSVPMCSMNCTALIRFLRGLCVWSTQEQKRTLLLHREHGYFFACVERVVML
jgi:uncharacterized membrane protein